MQVGLFIIALIGVAVAQDTLVDIRIQPEGAQDFSRHDRVLITCFFESWITDPRWKLPGGVQVTDTTQGFTLDKEEKTLFLTIQNITSNDAGMYECQGYNQNTNDTVSTSLRITVYDPIKFVNPKENQAFEQGRTVSVQCEVSGNPPATVFWTRESNKFTKDPANRVYEDSTNLVIQNITKADEGNYACVARQTTKAKEKILEIFVDVQYGPAGIQVPTLVKGIAGSDITITCESDGEPDPSFRWYRGASQLVENRITENISVDGRTLTLVNPNITASGEYTCVAENVLGNKSNTTQVVILVHPSFVEQNNMTVTENQDGTISCVATGVPGADVRVYKNEELLENGKIDQESAMTVDYLTKNKATVTFRPATFMDDGDYKCVATNEAGVAVTYITLNVLYAPRKAIVPKVYACIGGQAELSCSFEGKPLPSLSWGDMPMSEVTEDVTESMPSQPEDGAGRNKTLLLFTSDVDEVVADPTQPPVSRKFVPVMSSANIDVMNDMGQLLLKIQLVDQSSFKNYYCQATNDHGSTIASTQLLEASKPDVPTNLMISRVGTQNATVTFSPPDNVTVPIMSYTVEARSTAGPKLSAVVIPDDNLPFLELSHTFTKLQHNTKYRIFVKAQNCQGEGKYAKSRPFTTEVITKPGRASIVTPTEPLEPTSYSIQWNVGNTGGGKISKVDVTYWPITKGGNKTMPPADQVTTVTYQSTDREFVDQKFALSGLKPETTYRVKLTVTNEVGSAHSYSEFKTPPKPTEATTTGTGRDLNAGASNDLIIGVIVAVALILLIIVDISCCISRKCGCTHFIYINTCGASKKDSKTLENKDLEEGSAEYRKNNKSDEVTAVSSGDKQPLTDEAEPVANGTQQEHGIVNEETPLNDEQVLNGEKPTSAETPLVANEQDTPANSPLEGKPETKPPIKSDDVTVAVGNAEKPKVEETTA